MSASVFAKTSLEEIKTKYSLEPELLEVYVEGHDDVLFYSHHVDNSYSELHFIDISFIDFEGVVPEQDDYERNNRDRVIYLIDYLQQKGVGKYVFGIIDKDIIPFTRGLPSIDNLLTTDYSCLEMYCLSKENVDKVQGLRFRKITYKYITEIMNALLPLSAYRVFEKRRGYSLTKIKLGKYFDSLECSFDYERFIRNALISMGKSNLIDNALDEVKKIICELRELDLRDCIRGHDLFEVLSDSIHKFEKKPLDMDSIEDFYRISIESSFLSDSNLFRRLKQIINDHKKMVDGQALLSG